MYIIVYGILDEKENELSIDGPFFYQSEKDKDKAEILARELGNTKSKNQYMPWVFGLKENETVPQAMIRIEKGWFARFKTRTIETHNTVQKDNINSTCPFNDISLEKILRNY